MRAWLMVGVAATLCGCKSDSHGPAADNTRRNVRDRGESAATADTAVTTRSDLELTQKIRRAVVVDDELSITAKNVKILVNDGIVTLKGPVKSTTERVRIEQIALAIAGADNTVVNQLEIAN